MRVVIIGAGQVGMAITGALAAERLDVVAVDLDEGRLAELREAHDIQTICGSGSNPGVLKDAGVSAAEMVVAVTDSDEVNLVASMVSFLRAPHAIRVARIRELALIEDPRLLGPDGFHLDHAINPELVTAQRLADIISVPFAIDVAECGPGIRLVGLKLPAGTPLDGRTFAELRAAAPQLKVLVTNLVRGGESRVPRGGDDLRAGDTLYAVARADDLPHVAELFHLPWRPARRITIAGGGGVGSLLARRLENGSRLQVKLIEPDHQRALALSESLSRTLVLSGSPTDEGLLLEENVRDCDVFIAALPEEETNVMAALNARRLGAHRVIALTDKLSYVSMVENAGVDAIVSPRALAIGTIIHHVRKGRIKAVIPYGGAIQTQAIEFEARETAPAVGKPLKQVRFPEGAIVGLLVRDGAAIIPGGDDVIMPGDDVFVFASKAALPKIEKLISVRLEFF
jgi:trk system potassium uptake protein TrkA